MSTMAREEEEEEEKVLEEQLELQLQDQKDSLSEIKQALLSDPTNSELLAVEEELISCIKDAEEGLFGLKRVRLLREVDAMQGPSSSSIDAVAEPTDSSGVYGFRQPGVEKAFLDPNDVKVQTLEEPVIEEPSYRVGSKCRFRYTDGRWYNGQIVELDNFSSARVSFLTPTSENKMICKFFLQQRCRFGASCRLSHGTLVPVSSLKKYVAPCWGLAYVGAGILAVSGSGANIWRDAELKSWDDQNNRGVVVFRDDGSTETVGHEALALSQHEAEPSDDGGSEYTSSEDLETSDFEEGRSPQGLGFVETTALQKGVQTDTTIFATWENHTRGIASKMMANMGYREGMGLGSSGQGRVNPIPVKVLPAKQSLDHALRSCKSDENGGSQEKQKKRSRGGKRKRDRKFAEASRVAKLEEEEQTPDVFSLINSHLQTHAQMTSDDSGKKQKSKEMKKEDRRSLLAYEEEVKELRIRVEKLEEMVNRNRKEKAVYEAAMRKLTETRKVLAEAEAKHASTSHALVSKEKEKRWLRF